MWGLAMNMLRFILVTLFTLVAVPTHGQNDAGVFTPQNGFSGLSEGNGTLRLFFSHKPFHVENHGFDRPDGSFQLDQTVQFEGNVPETRTWLMRRSNNLHYTATLSGAAGTVTGEASGSRLTLRYRIKGPLVMHQTLTLATDGKSIDNVGRVTLFGIPVGSLHELIQRKG
jgi:hypothetical protein